jgi:FdhE protein
VRLPDIERRRLRQLESRRDHLGDVLDFMGALALATERVRPAYDEPREALRPGGPPPIAPERFPLDERAAAEAFEAFGELLERRDAAMAAQLRDAVAAGALRPADACRAFLARDQQWFDAMRDRHGLDTGFLARLAELALRPQAVERARRYDVGDHPPADRCPVCGSPPEMAFIADRDGVQGARIGVCGFCETEWRVARARCLRCGNDAPGTLGRLQARDDPAVSAAICDACRSYLIVVDARGRLDFAPAVERAAALPLDAVAQAEGYGPVGERRE